MAMRPYVLAVDPGDEHVGWADWRGGDRVGVRAGEVDARIALVKLDLALSTSRREWDCTLVLEDFVLYPGQDRRATWQPLYTAEMLGALKWIARQLAIPIVVQGAHIKKSTRAQLPARGIQQVGSGPHARDAELHLYHYLLKERHV